MQVMDCQTVLSRRTRKELAVAIQVRPSEFPMCVNLGQYIMPAAMRNTFSGQLDGPVPIFWNIKKKQ